MSSSHTRSRRNTFSAIEIDRDAERRGDAVEIDRRLRSDEARFLLLRDDGHALIDASGQVLHGLGRNDFVRLGGVDETTIHLGRVQKCDWFAWRQNTAACEQIKAQAGGEFIDLRSAGTALGADDAGLFAYARALQNWQERTRFCSVCGSRLQLDHAGHRAKCTNPQCGIEHFPRTDPAIIVVVSCGDACLLGRQASWPQGRYSALAGFVEPGETLEAAVLREVHEEAGVRVIDCDYHSSQPWPFPASIMLGFSARSADRSIRIGSELEDARWFTAPQILDGMKSGEVLLPPKLSVAYRLIEDWLRDAGGIELDAVMPARSR
jgi:NAD+ diphosphatase